MSLSQLWLILRARWWVVALVMAIVISAAVAASLMMPKRFTASAQVIVDVKSPDPIAGLALPAQMLPGYLATQIDIITSQSVALRVVDKLKIVENPLAVEQWREETDGVGSIRHYYADLLVKNLDVKPARESSVLTIAFSGVSPEFVAAVANEFAQAYIATSLDIKVEPAKQSRRWFDEQTRALRERLDMAQRRLGEYQRNNGIVSTDERLDVESARLQELSSQLVTLSSLAVESSKRERMAREAMAGGGASGLPDVLQNPLVQQLKAEQARVEAKLKEQSANLGRNHPEILKLQQESEALRARVAQEVDTVARSLTASNSVTRQRETEVRSALERQRTKVLQIKQSRDELQVLQRDVENAQRSYDTVAQRLTQTSLESQATQGNIIVLNPAVAPLDPSRPRMAVNVVLAIFFGLMLGLASALLFELRSRKIRSFEDLVAATSAPALGRIRMRFMSRRRSKPTPSPAY